MIDPAVARQKCAEKTGKKNLFRSKSGAKRAASKARRETGSPIHWFRCTVCGYYHLGGRRCTMEERLTLALWQALREERDAS